MIFHTDDAHSNCSKIPSNAFMKSFHELLLRTIKKRPCFHDIFFYCNACQSKYEYFRLRWSICCCYFVQTDKWKREMAFRPEELRGVLLSFFNERKPIEIVSVFSLSFSHSTLLSISLLFEDWSQTIGKINALRNLNRCVQIDTVFLYWDGTYSFGVFIFLFYSEIRNKLKNTFFNTYIHTITNSSWTNTLSLCC